MDYRNLTQYHLSMQIHSPLKTPLRVMQVMPFYENYLATYYGTRLRMSGLSEKEQTQALLRDGFYALHAFVPHLPPEKYETDFVVPNCRHTQRAWAKECGVAFPDSGWETEILIKRVEAFRPEVIYMYDPVRYDTRFFNKLSYKPSLVLGWRGADVPCNVDWSGYGAILSGLPGMLEQAVRQGAKEGLFFLPGVSHSVVKSIAHIPKDTDIVFAGGLAPAQHSRRLEVLDALARGAAEHGFSLSLYLSCPPSMITQAMKPYVKPPVFGMAMHRALARGRIVVDVQGSISLLGENGERLADLAGGYTVNMRLFEATAGGSLLLTDSLPHIGKLFEPGREIATYDNEADLLDKVLFFLGRYEERETVAEAGQRRCLRDYSMDRAVQKFMEIIADRLPGTG